MAGISSVFFAFVVVVLMMASHALEVADIPANQSENATDVYAVDDSYNLVTEVPLSPATTSKTPSPGQCSEFIDLRQRDPDYSCTHSGPLLATFLEFIKHGFNTMDCGQSSNIRKAAYNLQCTFDAAYNECVGDNIRKTATTLQFQVPTLAATENAINTLCIVNRSMDWRCLSSRICNIQTCAESDVKAYAEMKETGSSYTVVDTCSLVSLTTLCALENLEQCGEVTSHPIAAILNTQLSPRGLDCAKGWPSGALPLSSFCSVFVVAMALFLSAILS